MTPRIVAGKRKQPFPRLSGRMQCLCYRDLLLLHLCNRNKVCLWLTSCMCSNSKASYHPYTMHVTSAARAMVLLPLCGEQGYSASSSAASSSGGTSSIEVRDAVNKVFFFLNLVSLRSQRTTPQRMYVPMCCRSMQLFCLRLTKVESLKGSGFAPNLRCRNQSF